jgi:ribosomal protein S18 acetylase RimI-like enzyme
MAPRYRPLFEVVWIECWTQRPEARKVARMESSLMPYESLSPQQHLQVLNIALTDEQNAHFGDLHGVLHALTARPPSDIQGFVLLVEAVPRGLFLLKRRRLLPPWAHGNTATLHALMIDHRYQGLGLGKHCLQKLPGLVRSLWPDTEQLMLAVETGNARAFSLYQTLGWRLCDDAHQPAAGFERRMVLKLV